MTYYIRKEGVADGEVDAALRAGAAEIANDAGAVLYRISIERE